MWPSLIRNAKEGGLNAIETYVFWNAHEPHRREVTTIDVTTCEMLSLCTHNTHAYIQGKNYIYCKSLTLFMYYFQYDFTRNLDLIRFIRTIQDEGMYAILRIGPYVCAEWNFG